MSNELNTYSEYINGEVWRLRRRAYLRDHPACAMCGIPDRIHVTVHGRHLDVHHLSYARLGEELDEDLMALCRSCHKKRESVGTVPVTPEKVNFVPDSDENMSPVEYWEKAVAKCRDSLSQVPQDKRDGPATWRLVWAEEFAKTSLAKAKESAVG